MMNSYAFKYFNHMTAPTSGREAQTITTLIVGDPSEVTQLGSYLKSDPSIFFIEYSDLTKEIFTAFNPATVRSCAVSIGFDCLDLAHFLKSCHFSGQYQILMSNIARPDVVFNEIREHDPEIGFDVVQGSTHMDKTSPIAIFNPHGLQDCDFKSFD